MDSIKNMLNSMRQNTAETHTQVGIDAVLDMLRSYASLENATSSAPATPANNTQSTTVAANLDNSVEDGLDDEDYQLQVKQEVKTEDEESDEDLAPSSHHSRSTRYTSGEI